VRIEAVREDAKLPSRHYLPCLSYPNTHFSFLSYLTLSYQDVRIEAMREDCKLSSLLALPFLPKHSLFTPFLLYQDVRIEAVREDCKLPLRPLPPLKLGNAETDLMDDAVRAYLSRCVYDRIDSGHQS
jgi:hypothetical protein